MIYDIQVASCWKRWEKWERFSERLVQNFQAVSKPHSRLEKWHPLKKYLA